MRNSRLLKAVCVQHLRARRVRDRLYHYANSVARVATERQWKSDHTLREVVLGVLEGLCKDDPLLAGYPTRCSVLYDEGLHKLMQRLMGEKKVFTFRVVAWVDYRHGMCRIACECNLTFLSWKPLGETGWQQFKRTFKSVTESSVPLATRLCRTVNYFRDALGI